MNDRRLATLRLLSLVGALFTALVIMAGAFTRLLDAGLGCPDWPGCYGALVVPDASSALLHSPDAPLEASKAWMEMIHRYLAGCLGVMVMALLVLAWPRRRKPGFPWRLMLILFAALMVQGAFGAYTVTLKLWPQVVTLHLLGGLTVMTLFIWLHLRLRRVARGEAALAARPLGALMGVATMLLVLQLALGGWTSSNYAGIACQGFPTCNSQWVPDTDWGEGFHLTQTVGPNYLHGALHAEARTTIHLAHRLGALVLTLALALVVIRRWHRREMRPWLLTLAGATALQVALGIANVLLWLPLGLALLHTAGAVLLVFSFTLVAWKQRHSRQAVKGRQRQTRGGWLHA
ncbi:COX15/CtaA family protein [Halomonas sp. H10-59]|uniref:COX15/CtaA family protein n=1 Tax=Halomonas sp. H10-59 TaxID=2950874 RepID=A0AAU7KZA7_9GAMM